MQKIYKDDLDSDSELLAKSGTEPVYESYADILPDIPVLPDENPMDFAAFQEGLLKELAPSSPYQHIVAQNIISNEWEMFRLRRWRGILLSSMAEEQLIPKVARRFAGKPEKITKIIAALKYAMNNNISDKPEKVKQLEEFGADPARGLAHAYMALEETLLGFEHQIMTLEIRRKRLREEFKTMKSEHRAANSNRKTD